MAYEVNPSFYPFTEPEYSVGCYIDLRPAPTPVLSNLSSIEQALLELDCSKKISMEDMVDHCCNTFRNILFSHEEDRVIPPKIKADIINVLNLLSIRYGLEAVRIFLVKIANRKTNIIWFDLAINTLYELKHTELLISLLKELDRTVQSPDSPLMPYVHVLEKIRFYSALNSEDGYFQFMNWLVLWDISQFYPKYQLLEHVDMLSLLRRPDIKYPYEFSDEQKVKISSWGEETNIKEYLAETQYVHHYMLCAFIEHAPLKSVISLTRRWMFASDCEHIRAKLFVQSIHPFDLCEDEPRPFHIFLQLLKRLPIDNFSEMRRDISKLQGDNIKSILIDEALDFLNRAAIATVFGRTIFIGFNEAGQKVYLKINERSESKQLFFKEAERIDFFYQRREALGIESNALELHCVAKIPSLSKILDSFSLSDIEKAKILWRCCDSCNYDALPTHLFIGGITEKLEVEQFCKATAPDEIFKSPNILNHQSLLNIVQFLLARDTSCHGMILIAPVGHSYEKYVYDCKSREEAVTALTNSATELGSLWNKGILGPEVCSSFHNRLSKRVYFFLAPYFGYFNLGSIADWSGYSTNYPNVGIDSTRDRGDAKAFDEGFPFNIRAPKTFKDCPEQLQHKIFALEALAKTAWGSALEFGRFVKGELKPNYERIQKIVREDMLTLLQTLFCNAFKVTPDDCNSWIQEHDLLEQVSREMNLWMSTAYPVEVRQGLIPQHSYPDYKGARSGHILCNKYQESLTDSGFQWDSAGISLGAPNGRNLLMALEAVVIKVMVCGCLERVRSESIG
ncbi:hypothetical protein [Parashewanella tropica]|uniref:hypothetical protein n=1 Tax=Parashewanella tropica TaxID=2547970 RepID=UPI00105A8FCA|nr:hypothetical protein [Parashewanella tropica]